MYRIIGFLIVFIGFCAISWGYISFNNFFSEVFFLLENSDNGIKFTTARSFHLMKMQILIVIFLSLSLILSIGMMIFGIINKDKVENVNDLEGKKDNTGIDV